MGSSTDPRHVAQVLLAELGLDVVSCAEMQSLWAGYGHICAVEARPSPTSPRHSSSGSISSIAAAAATIHETKLSEPPRESVNKDKDDGDGTLHLVLKLISPPTRHGDEGHLRKMLSYQVEQYFYDEVAPALAAGEDDGGPAVAVCLASTRRRVAAASSSCAEPPLGNDLIATVMTDLRGEFPVAGEKRAALDARQVHAALEWLARFHGGSWKLLGGAAAPAGVPRGHHRLDDALLLPPLEEEARRKQSPGRAGRGQLWLNGGYTYLATRRKEYAALARDGSSEWCAALCKPLNGGGDESSSASVAELVAEFLTPRGRPFETYIHGDVKSENLFATDAGDRVAFFDFQYAGVGLGVCDLAKLFTCSVPLDMLINDDDDDDHHRHHHRHHHDGEGHAAASMPPHRGLLAMMGAGERRLLEEYRSTLLARRRRGPSSWTPPEYPWETFVRHWEAALVDWCRFQASWGFWGNTEWLQARVRSILGDEQWREWLLREVSSA
ncbi:hypothetical protein JDV02_005263 [Purpureocillium takamizusanense]|uniref:Aminoglycoside phosphotransferase domain-containing protein n=1 Tax=Purpureocillium takamizusanense TaxID=2060973 RepID=A0A9Q8QFM1_9HYPO|nr:uncharacterized protein JDV02_005263 [Purpureocillium takamizusanense]UNI19043.1 hypothetical protein JDV02_005263 [Purpureocillium takamizusanense]